MSYQLALKITNLTENQNFSYLIFLHVALFSPKYL